MDIEADLIIGIKILTFLLMTYYSILSIAGLIYKFSNREQITEVPEKKFAFIIPAYNEKDVIEYTLKSIQMLNYPKGLYDTYVIADNCTDNTADISRNNGAYVLERFNESKVGKGYALSWGFDHIKKLKKTYDAYIILDADNLMSPDFLLYMNQRLLNGEDIIQGYIDCKNPYDTWITAGYAMATWLANIFFQNGHSLLKLTNQLGGTGFCISSKMLNQYGWDATCLTEDLEFTVKAVLSGHKVTWCRNAVVYDEKPLFLGQSIRQRIRWMQGFTDVMKRYFIKLIAYGIKTGNISALDCALYTLQPLINIFFGSLTLLNLLQFIIPMPNYYISIPLFNDVWTAVCILQFIISPLTLLIEKKVKNIKEAWFYITYQIYLVTWLWVSIVGILHSNERNWSHTKHVRAIDVNEVI